jgi:hypothetical protein
MSVTAIDYLLVSTTLGDATQIESFLFYVASPKVSLSLASILATALMGEHLRVSPLG